MASGRSQRAGIVGTSSLGQLSEVLKKLDLAHNVSKRTAHLQHTSALTLNPFQ